jgi:hypothetical protein
MDLDSDQAKKIFSKFTPQLLWTIVGVLLFVVAAGSVAWYKTIKDTEKLIALNNQQLDNNNNTSKRLVDMTWRGGLCMDDKVCESKVTILTNGDYVIDNKVIKRMANSELQELTRQINSADYVKIKSNKFTGTCPMAYDGQEAVYTFYVGNKTEVIASCTVEIDYKSEPFQLLTTLQLR